MRREYLRALHQLVRHPGHQPARRSHQADHRTLPAVLVSLPQENGDPLSFRTQHARLVTIRVWFRWMARHNHILYNPASDIELPRL